MKTILVCLLAVLGHFAVTSCLQRSIAHAADATPQSVTVTTGDGSELSARYFLGNRGAKSPAVLLLDDLGDDARPEVCDAVARRLAKEGCTVLCFDFRGHGGSRAVNPEFWNESTNRRFIKGFKAVSPPQAIGYGDFRSGYLPVLVNDVAAARAYLDRRNDAGECNTAQVFVVGFGRGATIGQIWLASEWSRYRKTGFQPKLSSNPEGVTIAGCVWLDPKFALDRQAIPLFELLKKSEQKLGVLVGLIHDTDDSAAGKFARRCRDELNQKGGGKLFVAEAVPADGNKPLALRDGVTDRVAKLVANMRKVQDLPPWDDRDFVDRRYVWAFPGNSLILAKDEGEEELRPVPVGRVLSSR